MSKVSFVSCWMVNNYRAWIQRLFLLICELNVDMAIWHVRNNITHGEGQDHLEHLFISRSCIGKNCVLLPIRHNDPRWQRVEKTRKSADTEPVGRGFGSGFVPAGAGAGTNSNPTDIC